MSSRRLIGVLAFVAGVALGCGSDASEVSPTASSTFATADGGDDTTSTAGTDSGVGSDTGDSTGSVPEPACGNQTVEPGEDCDDANTEPLDGCLSNCRTGPTGIGLTPGTALMYQGGGGGVRYDDVCPTPEALLGIRGQASGVLQRLQAICGALSLSESDGALVVTVDESTVLPERGTGTGTPFEMMCPPDHIVTGFDGNAGDRLDGFALSCAPITVVADDERFRFAVDAQAVVELERVGGSGGIAFGPLVCSPDEVVTGSLIRAGGEVDGLGLSCSLVELTYP